jgi:hypothetical protein
MINSVPIKINQAARTVTLKHPNSLDCTVYRKVLLRTSDETMGGLPTLGGLGVLKGEDEPEFEYQALGPAKVLMTGQYEAADLVDRGDAIAPPAAQIEAQIECVDVPGFELRKNDLLAVMPGGGVVIGYEVVGMTSSVNIFPYTQKWVIAPRDDLHDLEPWQD